MTHEASTNNTNQAPWPDFFEVDQSTTEQTAHAPKNLIDAFYIRPYENGPTTFIGVVGNEDGSLQTVVNDSTLPLSGSIPEQVEAVRIAQRDIFRGITADRIAVLGINAIEQNIATRGFNDPVALYGDLATANPNGPEHANATRRGRMVVGRLDFLQAYRTGIDNALRSVNPENANARIIPLLLPVGANQNNQRPEVVLAYPIFDPMTVEYGDNGVFTRHIVYDLLVRLQHDLVEEGVSHPLSSYELPVPNRKRLEAELAVDGYRIEGDQAVRVKAQSNAPAQGLLGRLRQITQGWGAERITLPPEATDVDYVAVIDEIVPHIQTPHDRAIATLAGSMVAARVAYTEARPAPFRWNRPAAQPVARPAPAQPGHPPRPSSAPANQSASQPPKKTDYSQVFATSAPSPEAAKQAARTQWEQAFDIVGHMPLSANVPASPAAHTTHATAAGADKWGAVFETPTAPEPAARADKWAGVFATASSVEQTAPESLEVTAPAEDAEDDDGGDKWAHIFKQ